MFRYLVTALVMFSILSLAPAVTMGQNTQTKQEKKTAKVKEKIQKFGAGEKAKVKIKTYSGVTYQGYVSSSASDDFVVIDKGGTSHTVRYSDVDKIGGKNLSTGAKIGIGIGIGAGALALILLAIFASLDD